MNSQTEYQLQALEPFLEMLREKESELSRSDWEHLVNSTRERIVAVPEQYLPGVTRPSDELTKAIELIFNERLN
ncbi:MAG TPA: hypothetical protein VFE50_01950 [Cyclobacteriaceae bacterium]|nr:hypothetical protein [Cyclobacteriaceae bacterium]